MKAIVWHGPGRMAIEERPEPDGSPVADKLRRAWDLLSGNY